MDEGIQIKIGKILDEYYDDAVDEITKATNKVANYAVKELKATSPRDTGEYAGGWKKKVDKNRLKIEAVVYNGTSPGLTHLLEHGHVTSNGNGRIYPRTPAHPHIDRVNKEAQKMYLEELERRLSK